MRDDPQWARPCDSMDWRELVDGLARTRRRIGRELADGLARKLADGLARTRQQIGENSPTPRRLAVKYAHRARELGSATLAAVRHVLDVIGMKSGLERPHHQTPAASRTRQHQTRQARFSYDLAVHGKSPPPCARAGERANPLQASSYVVHPTPRNRLRVRLPPQFGCLVRAWVKPRSVARRGDRIIMMTARTARDFAASPGRAGGVEAATMAAGRRS
jgi:hypothetical protein